MAYSDFLPCIKCIAGGVVVAALAGVGFLYSGLYPMGTDDQHNDLTYWALETLRERSIARAANDIEVPTDLDLPERLLSGGADYNDMCASCHLKPGKTESDFSIGLYPSPPNLTLTPDEHGNGGDSETDRGSLRRQFWIINHGIKASGMPAWGPNHSDERIWNMVAFLQRLPSLTEAQYQILTARGEEGSVHH